MIREFYRGLNFFLLLVLTVLICAFQSVILKSSLISWLELDLSLLMVVYIALHRSVFEGAILVLLIGRINEIHSSSPAGLIIIGYMFVYLLILFVRKLLLVGTSMSAIFLAMVGGLTWKLTYLLIAAQMGLFSNVWKNTLGFLIPYLLGLGIFSRSFFALLKKIDTATYVLEESEAKQLSGEDF